MSIYVPEPLFHYLQPEKRASIVRVHDTTANVLRKAVAARTLPPLAVVATAHLARALNANFKMEEAVVRCGAGFRVAVVGGLWVAAAVAGFYAARCTPDIFNHVNSGESQACAD